MLFSLTLVPLVAAIYLHLQRRRRALAASFVRSEGSEPARKRWPGFRRHLPPTLFLIGLVILLVALARPQAELSLPRVEGTVILVIDVSGSMAADDAEPTRLEAAKASAQAFILSQPATVRIGVVSFSGSGFAVQTPTNDTADLVAAIGRLEPQKGTSLGQGILVALKTLAVDAGLELPPGAEPEPTSAPGETAGTQQQRPSDNNLLAQLPEGSYPAAKIVLFSDGENTESINPLEAAQVAAEHDVRIDVLGFGTAAGITLAVNGYRVHTAMDEETLQQIAQTTGGSYYTPQDEQDPRAIYANLSLELVIKSEKMEITSIFAGASILVLLLGAVFSMLWFNRLP